MPSNKKNNSTLLILLLLINFCRFLVHLMYSYAISIEKFSDFRFNYIDFINRVCNDSLVQILALLTAKRLNCESVDCHCDIGQCHINIISGLFLVSYF